MKITKITRLPAPETTENSAAVRIPSPANTPEPDKLHAPLPAPDWTAENAAAKTGRASTLSICRAILKNAARENLKYPHADKDGHQHFSDGYRDLCLYTPLEGFPALPENLEPADLDRFYPAENGVPLELPDAKALRAWIKTEKARMKTAKTHYPPVKYPIYNFGPDLPAVNAEYLLSMLEALPGCTAEFTYQSPNNTQIITFHAENGKALLMPVHKWGGVKDELPKTDLTADQAKIPEPQPERKPSHAKITPAIPAAEPETPDYYASRSARDPETDEEYAFVHIAELLRAENAVQYDDPTDHYNRYDSTDAYIDVYRHSPHSVTAEYHRKAAIYYLSLGPFARVREILKPYEGKPIGDKRAREIRQKINDEFDYRGRCPERPDENDGKFYCENVGYKENRLVLRLPVDLDDLMSHLHSGCYRSYTIEFGPHDRKTDKTMIDPAALKTELPDEPKTFFLRAENDEREILRQLHRLETLERIRMNEEAETLESLRLRWRILEKH